MEIKYHTSEKQMGQINLKGNKNKILTKWKQTQNSNTATKEVLWVKFIMIKTYIKEKKDLR